MATTLPKEIFGLSQEDVAKNVPVMHQVVVAQQAAARQGTHKVKTRAEVSGGGKKPFKQKGTGRARQGSTRAPHFTGGGVVHGPTPRDYSQKVPKKLKRLALISALSDRAFNQKVFVVDGFGITNETPSTKAAILELHKITDDHNVLVLVNRPNDNLNEIATCKSLRNVDGVQLLYVDQINTYDVLVNDSIVFTESSLNEFLENFKKSDSSK